MEDEITVTKNEEVTEIFNTFFFNVDENIGKDYVFNPNDHPSITKLENKNLNKESFEF